MSNPDQPRRARNLRRSVVWSGFGLTLLLVLIRGIAFYEGYSFTKGLIAAPLVLLVFGCLLWLFFGLIYLVAVLVRGKAQPKWAWALLLPVLVWSALEIPIPSFYDGLHLRLKREFANYPFRRYAGLVREAKIRVERDYATAKFETDLDRVRKAYPELANIADVPPSFRYEESYIDQSYGSGLTGYWGFRIVDQEVGLYPFDENEPKGAKEVFPGVWLYSFSY